MQTNNREQATILAALRMWQGTLTNALGIPAALIDVAQDAGPMLEAGEIDELCERLNCEPAPELRRYIAIRIDAGLDSNGNGRRGFLVYADKPDPYAEYLGFVEGYAGDFALHEAVRDAEAGAVKIAGDAAGRRDLINEARAVADSGRVRVVCALKVPYSEVREARRHKFGLS